MKVKFDDKIIVFLHKTFIEGFDLKNENKLEEYFRDLFLKLKKRYNIELNGYFNIDVYPDNHYGIILEIENLDVDYYQYFSQIDMKINVRKNSSFLYQIDYNLLENSTSFNYYMIKDKLYVQIKKEIDEVMIGKLLECSTIIYGNKKDEIIKYGKKVKL